MRVLKMHSLIRTIEMGGLHTAHELSNGKISRHAAFVRDGSLIETESESDITVPLVIGDCLLMDRNKQIHT